MESFGEATLAALMEVDIVQSNTTKSACNSNKEKQEAFTDNSSVFKKVECNEISNLEQYFNDSLEFVQTQNSMQKSSSPAFKYSKDKPEVDINLSTKATTSHYLDNSSESLFSSFEKTSEFDQPIDPNDSDFIPEDENLPKKDKNSDEINQNDIQYKEIAKTKAFDQNETDVNNCLKDLEEIEWNTENISFSQINIQELQNSINILKNISNNSMRQEDSSLINKIIKDFTESDELIKDSVDLFKNSDPIICENVSIIRNNTVNKAKHNVTSNSIKSEDNSEKDDDFQTVSINTSSSSKLSFHTTNNKSFNIKTNPLQQKIQSRNSIRNSLSSSINSSSFVTVVPQNCSISMSNKTLSNEDKLLLKNWGLPPTILKEYANRGITKLFPWQVECLEDDRTLNGGENLVYSAPTSAGKTLVSEILMIKAVLERHKKVLVILPFVSVVREKMFYFQDILGSSGVRVSGYMGSHSPPGGFQATHIAICTIEKANSLINRVLSDNTLGDIGAIILDELHLIGDPGRGYILELLLTKIKYMLLKDNSIKIQLVGMSATLPNLPLLAEWLNARLYKTDFRPIPLEEQCKIDNIIYNNENKIIRQFIPHTNFPRDPDNIIQLCVETISESCSVLVFCPTKNWCENLSQQIANAFMQLMKREEHPIGAVLRDQLNMKAIEELTEQLKNCPVGLDSVLKNTISYACAFHHAGLTMDERDIIEGGFRNNSLRVLIATSTLSSGVNLPARRVIIRSPIFHGKPLNSLTYRQMIGRAGRMGKDTKGESLLVCTKKDENIARNLISAHLQPVYSCLEGEGKLKRAILEIIASGMASSPEDIEKFTKSTLLSVVKYEEDCSQIESPIQDTVKFLTEFELIRLQDTDEGPKYLATPLGKACLSSSLPPEDGLMLFTELQRARQCFVLETELHMIYLVTPYSVSSQLGNIDWLLVLELWEQLTPAMKKVGDLVGVQESFLVRAVRGTLNLNTPKMMHKMQIHRRFYTALALQELVNEVPLTTVAEKFKCSRGVLQSLQQSAATFAGMVTSFSHQLGWDSVEILISQFQHRLQFGVQRELIDLMRLPLLNGNRARAIFKAGVETLLQLATADVCVIENALHFSIPFQSENKREDDCEFDVQERNKLKSIWVTGKAGLTPREAANLLILDARKFLEIEMGLSNVNWNNRNVDEEMDISSGTTSLDNSETVKNNSITEISENIVSDLIDTKQDRQHDGKSDSSSIKVELVNNEVQNVNSQTKSNFDVPRIHDTSDSASNSSLISSLNLSDSSKKAKRIKTNNVPKYLNNKTYLENSYNLRNRNSGIENLPPNSQKNISAFNESLGLDSKIMQDLDIVDDFNLKLKTKEINKTPPKYESKSATKSDILETPKRVTRNMKRKSESPDENEIKRLSIDDVIVCSQDEENNTPKSLSELSRTQKKRFKRNKSECSKKEQTEDLNTQVDDDPKILKILGKIELVTITKNFEDFMAFHKMIKAKCVISVSVDCDKLIDSKPIIGKRIVESRSKISKDSSNFNCIIRDSYIKGIYFYSGDHKLYFLSLQNDSVDVNITLKHRLDLLNTIFSSKFAHIRAYDSKKLYKLLYKGCQIEIKSKLRDPRIADWLLHSKEATYTLAQIFKLYLPNLVPAMEGLGNRLQASVDSIATWFLLEDLYAKLKENEKLHRAFSDTEMPSVVCLAKMEINGIGLNCRALQKLNCSVEEKMQKIQNEAYTVAGRRFNMSSSKEVAKVLGIFRGRKVSTSKKVLETIDNPISNLIMLWRKLNNTLTSIIYPLLRSITSYNRLHGYFIMQTVTGRISMAEPNIQNVPKDFAVDQEIEKLSCRSVFQARDGYCIVSADYCQLELRILSHLSKDPILCDILRTKKDVFKSMAALWNHLTEDEVDDTLRQHTKQIVYGMIYGMGTKALAHTLDVTELEAATFLEKFNKAYPGLIRYTKSVIKECSKTGYIETLNGRRRYLPNINQQNGSLKGQAERQAVNTTVQGSAADISKMAMLLVESKVSKKFPNVSQIYYGAAQEKENVDNICFILHMHDELIYEVKKTYSMEFAKILKDSMENVVKLRVPLPVKVKMGDSWGTVKELIS